MRAFRACAVACVSTGRRYDETVLPPQRSDRLSRSLYRLRPRHEATAHAWNRASRVRVRAPSSPRKLPRRASPRGMGANAMTVVALHGGTLHDVMCDAFLLHGGYVALDGALYEILTVEFDPCVADAFTWTTRRARYAGAA